MQLGIFVFGMMLDCLQISSGSLRESATGTQPCDPEATICIVGPERPGTEGKTEKPERQTEQPSEASEDTTVRPERQSEFSPEQQEDNAIELKDEQIRDVQQEDGDGIEERVEIDKKTPVIISGDNAYVVWL